MTKISHRAEDYASLEAFNTAYKAAAAESYEAYTAQGHSWCWCLVGNIVQEHVYGEDHEIRYGTKQFSRGTKVFLAPAQWGDGYEKIVAIGLPRYGGSYIEVITRSDYIENFRLKKVYQPAIIKRMCSSRYRWWGDTENDRTEIISYLESLSPDEEKRRSGS